MSFELQAVFGSAVILLILLGTQGTLVPLNQGFGWGLGSRDGEPEYTALQGRTRRTVANHIEGMMLFVPLIMIVELADLSSQLTIIGAGLYLAARVMFAPLYMLGVAYLRSVVWGVGLLGIMLIGFEVAKGLL